MSTLIKNATVITQNANRDIIENCDILINGNSIEAVGKNIKIENGKPETVIDATNKIALPGFINAHTHVAMTCLRGLGENLPLDRWLKEKIWPMEEQLTKEQIYQSSLLGIEEMIRSGITTFIDMYHMHPNEIAKACEKVGIRSSLSHTIFDRNGNGINKAERFVKDWKKSELIVPHVSAHSIYACEEELLSKAKELAKKENAPFHMHLAETRKEVFDCLEKTKKYPVEYIDSIGLIDNRSIFAHASWVTKREIGIIAKKKATIVNCPISNLKLATGGICPVREYYEQNAHVCIGTDGPASNNSLNMFESIKMSSLLQKHHYWKADALLAQAFLDFATRNGAQAIGINAGSIEKEKRADIILLDTCAPNLNPAHDIISNIVYAAHPGNVTDVIINGKQVLENRKIRLSTN